MTLEGLSMLTGTLVHTVMAVCQGNIASADIGGVLSSLSPFLGVSLEHMAASVSLINGRMPLNTTDEALQELARCAPSKPSPAAPSMVPVSPLHFVMLTRQQRNTLAEPPAQHGVCPWSCMNDTGVKYVAASGV